MGAAPLCQVHRGWGANIGGRGGAGGSGEAEGEEERGGETRERGGGSGDARTAPGGENWDAGWDGDPVPEGAAAAGPRHVQRELHGENVGAYAGRRGGADVRVVVRVHAADTCVEEVRASNNNSCMLVHKIFKHHASWTSHTDRS